MHEHRHGAGFCAKLPSNPLSPRSGAADNADAESGHLEDEKLQELVQSWFARRAAGKGADGGAGGGGLRYCVGADGLTEEEVASRIRGFLRRHGATGDAAEAAAEAELVRAVASTVLARYGVDTGSEHGREEMRRRRRVSRKLTHEEAQTVAEGDAPGAGKASAPAGSGARVHPAEPAASPAPVRSPRPGQSPHGALLVGRTPPGARAGPQPAAPEGDYPVS